MMRHLKNMNNFINTAEIWNRRKYEKVLYIDDVILQQPEVPFSTTVENLKWLGQEVTELWW